MKFVKVVTVVELNIKSFNHICIDRLYCHIYNVLFLIGPDPWLCIICCALWLRNPAKVCLKLHLFTNET